MLTIKHLTKQFGKKMLFRDLCLTVEGPAVLWAPSGWGKTTLLRILMGLEEPTSGIVQGVGRVAAVFQEDRLCPQLTAVQNVTLVLPGSAEQYKEQIIKDFQQFGMDAAALALPAARLSGGQKRRTALLRALWAASDTLLLDEPFTGMDPDTLAAAAALLRERCGEIQVFRQFIEALPNYTDDEGEIENIRKKLPLIYEYLDRVLINTTSQPTLYAQLQRNLVQINSLKEPDLCSSDIVRDRVFISTVHKAKGLEFDNVIVTSVIDGTYPFFKNHDKADILEDARKLYVAISRTKRTLVLTMPAANAWNYAQRPSRFLESISTYFEKSSA